jgi:cellulose synthase/poly-beta-1,6-N-acetylglucosamine synthase-like glycosyltransferase
VTPEAEAPGTDQPQSARQPRYVLATAAYNEAHRIGATLRAVAAQTCRPVSWVVVSDGSTDGTDDVVRAFAEDAPFVSLLRVEKSRKHDFGAKVHALRKAFEHLSALSYDFLGVLDADVSFAPDYFEELFRHFDADPRLGVAGGNVIQQVDGRAIPRIKDFSTVAGAVQMLRRECFEQTGGLPVLRYGGEDAAMEIAARMHGWSTQTFPELEVLHDGLVGAGAGGRTRARFKWGRANFALGYHPLYQVARAVNRTREKPYVVGSLAELLGYAVGRLEDKRPSVDAELVRHLRGEQLDRLRSLLTRG